MQKPTPPPETGNDTSSRFWQELEEKLAPLEDSYLHWDALQHKQMPVQGINHKQWWQLLKAKRRARMQRLPFLINQQQYYWVLDDELLKQLTAVERALSIHLPQQFTQRLPADNFIVETVASLQLSSDAINENQAHELLRTGRPTVHSLESVLEAHYLAHAEQFPQQLTAETLLQLQRNLLADETIAWRTSDGIIKDEQQVFYIAPPACEVHPAIEQLCAFANDNSGKTVMPPLIKAIILHYMIAVIRPFDKGNGRLGRALFYWQCLQAGYEFMQVVSLSQILLADKAEYWRAFLLSQTDSNDLTYFLMQQLAALAKAIAYSREELSRLQTASDAQTDDLNPRQRHILVEMQYYPQHQYRLARYKQRMQITYETSRTDLMKLAKKGYAKKIKLGKAFVYSLADE